MVVFHSYVSLPEGMLIHLISGCVKTFLAMGRSILGRSVSRINPDVPFLVRYLLRRPHSHVRLDLQRIKDYGESYSDRKFCSILAGILSRDILYWLSVLLSVIPQLSTWLSFHDFPIGDPMFVIVSPILTLFQDLAKLQTSNLGMLDLPLSTMINSMILYDIPIIFNSSH